MMFLIIVVIMAAGLGIATWHKRTQQPAREAGFPPTWRPILEAKVSFYYHLDDASRRRFEQDILRFLCNVRIEGVGTTVDLTDRLLVASSAVIPVFGFPDWDYTFLDEVLLYAGAFDQNYQSESRTGDYITGMVGTGGSMEGKMILSKPSLHMGFDNRSDKKNVGIHEFIHLLDKEDGSIDGIPTLLNKNAFALPWLELIREKTQEIVKGKNEIDTYGATNQTEFLAVVGEYFFERPHLLQKNHPELFTLLAKAFNQDTTMILQSQAPVRTKLGRNSPCPCGSGKKYKECCLQ